MGNANDQNALVKKNSFCRIGILILGNDTGFFSNMAETRFVSLDGSIESLIAEQQDQNLSMYKIDKLRNMLVRSLFIR